MLNRVGNSLCKAFVAAFGCGAVFWKTEIVVVDFEIEQSYSQGRKNYQVNPVLFKIELHETFKNLFFVLKFKFGTLAQTVDCRSQEPAISLDLGCSFFGFQEWLRAGDEQKKE